MFSRRNRRRLFIGLLVLIGAIVAGTYFLYDDSPAALQTLWKDIGAQSGRTAHSGIWGLVARPKKAVPYLRTVLKPAPGVEKGKLEQLLKDLDSDDFRTRDTASQELQSLGDLPEQPLRKLLLNPSSLEAEVRAKALLNKLAPTFMSPQLLQALRGVEALEHIGTNEARELLRELSRGSPMAMVTRAADAALERLAERR